MTWSPVRGLFKSQERCITGYIEPQKNERITKELEAIGKEIGAKADQVVYAWIMKHPSGPIPILGTSSPERVESAAKSIKFITALTREQWWRVWVASTGTQVP